MKPSSVFTLILLISSTDGSLPKIPRFKFGFGKGRSSQSVGDEEEYDYYDDETESNYQVSTKRDLLKVSGIAITCASLVGCGVLYRLGVRPSLRWFHKLRNKQHISIQRNDQESMNKDIEDLVKQKAQFKKEDPKERFVDVSKESIDTTSTSEEGDNDEEEYEEEESLNGIATALGNTLLKVSSNGTRLQSVNTTHALKGKTIALYFSSLQVEQEMKERNITRLMLGNHVEMVRQLTVNNGKPLEMVYVSLDDKARSFRDMLRALKMKNAYGKKTNESGSNEVVVEVLEDDEEYVSGGGWLAIPFSEREIIQKLNEKFIPAEGPPQIVMIDADDGHILNRGALSQMLANPIGYPWYSAKPLSILLGTEGGEEACSVVYPNNDNIKSAREAAADSKYIGLYFSADWCTPCKTFMPMLSKAYGAVNKRGKELEVFYVSLDRSKDKFTAFKNQMPWPALEFQGRKRAELEQALGVRALPCLIVFNKETGEVVTREGRSAVMEDPHGVKFPWHESAVTELTAPIAHTLVMSNKDKLISDDEDHEEEDETASASSTTTPNQIEPQATPQAPPKGLVDGIALVVFTDRTSNVKLKTTTKQHLSNVASKYLKQVALDANSLFTQSTQSPLGVMSSISKFRISFFLASSKSPILDAVRVLIGDTSGMDEGQPARPNDALFADLATSASSSRSKPPSAVILDIPNRRYFSCPSKEVLDESLLEQFMFDVFSGKVSARPLAVDLDGEKK